MAHDAELPRFPLLRDPIEPVPHWLAELLGPVLHDLQQPRPVAFRLGWTPAADERGGVLWLQEIGEVGGTGLHVPVYDCTADTLVHVAEQLQEQVFPETAGAWGEARPACPGHQHPADPEVRDGVAWWVCPATREPLWLIGEASNAPSPP